MITLISKENAPAGLTLYLAIDLNNGAKAMTGVYFPDRHPGDKKLDLILYLHGHDAPPINEYWKKEQFKLREEVNDSNKRLALIAPTLGANTPIRAARRPGPRTWNASSKTIPGSISISDSAISIEATSSSANPTRPPTMMFRRDISKNASTLACCVETRQSRRLKLALDYIEKCGKK